MGIATSAMIAAWLAVGTVNAVANPEADRKTEAELARMTAQMQALKADTNALQGTVATTAERIEARQQFLDALLTGRSNAVALGDLLPRATRATAAQAAETGVLAPFAALEAKQLALVDRAAATAETRLRDAEALIGRLGLKPSRFIAQSVRQVVGGNTGLGGPYIPASTAETTDEAHGADPRFTELFVNWQRVEQLESAMASIPAYVPVRNYTLTSSYGFRHDPFNGRSAAHAGLDMAGVTGEPVMAAAAGKIVRAGRHGGYGLVIDIDHGKGIMTRYAHLSRIGVKIGQEVGIGEKIGALGSTGRSTGPHLHYEVRIDGKAVNPRPFLEASSYILAYNGEVAGPPRVITIN
ncbi:MAG: M23 family metallopeptidase [Sphingomonadaceae bacterium]